MHEKLLRFSIWILMEYFEASWIDLLGIMIKLQTKTKFLSCFRWKCQFKQKLCLHFKWLIDFSLKRENILLVSSKASTLRKINYSKRKFMKNVLIFPFLCNKYKSINSKNGKSWKIIWINFSFSRIHVFLYLMSFSYFLSLYAFCFTYNYGYIGAKSFEEIFLITLWMIFLAY